jgi:class 3 adenylate cyclase/tetratricopeptide (TPR) repeat protein
MAEHIPPPPRGDGDVERLAAWVHEAWVEHRRSAGWQYGKKRDDEARTAPSMVPYEALPDSERELDRISVRATLDGLQRLGYRLERDPAAHNVESRERLLADVDRLIARGQPLPAYDLTKRWLATNPTDPEVRLRNARALRRCGALQRALTVLEDLSDRPDGDGERRGLLAAVNKELFIQSLRHGGSHGGDYLERAYGLYREVFDESGGAQYWHGINAATLAFLRGREDDARRLAERVARACDALEAGSSSDYWWLATRAEAALVLGRFDEAAASYRRALQGAADRIGDVASTRQNALLLLDAYGAAGAERRAVDDALRPPAVVVFAGPTIHSQHGDADLEPLIRDAIGERLDRLGAGYGFSGATPGTELLFVEAMLERQPSTVNVVLPWPREQFEDTHVRFAGPDWERRFRTALGGGSGGARPPHVVSASLGAGSDERVYEEFAQQLLSGLARVCAETLGTEVSAVCVTGAEPGAAGGDEPTLLERWQALGIRLPPENIIDLRAMSARRRISVALTSRFETRGAAGAGLPASRTMAILFADVEDYSRIAEDRLPAFIEYFVGGIGSRLGLKPYKPEHVRRVGDGLLMVFPTVRDAGLCALELVDWTAAHSAPAADGQTYWSRLGLPAAIHLRVALHAGPVFECIDPLTHVPTFEGTHINYAARIEPVTPGNHVYASEAFAALTASWPAPCDDFVCEYVGRTSLAKRAGEYPLYHVRRRA